MDRRDAKLRVEQATDIVRLIGEHIALKPAGSELRGVCPFHDDTNPSMNVSPRKQIYKCFSCGAGGDCFSFVMNYHKMSFPEALKYLADRAGIELPSMGGRGEDGGAGDLRQRMLKANEQAIRYYQKQLADPDAGRAARDYLADRGISDEMVEGFKIGYAPDAWGSLAETVDHHKLDREAFLETGLIAKRNDGRCYDRLRHRLVIPILDGIGRPIAFGGRALPGGSREDAAADAKYLNSPETPLFHKSRTLFGLNLAKKRIIDSRNAVIVEGYTDVIAAHQAGFANVIATLGTALTRDHARELTRYCDRVTLVFDADEAGQKAADRALEVFFAEPIDVSVAVLAEGQDPADLFATPDGPGAWDAAIKGAEDAMSFHHRRVRATFDAADTLAGRQRIAEAYLRTLVQLGLRQLEPARRGLVYAHVGDLLHLDRGTIDRMVREMSARQPLSRSSRRGGAASETGGAGGAGGAQRGGGVRGLDGGGAGASGEDGARSEAEVAAMEAAAASAAADDHGEPLDPAIAAEASAPTGPAGRGAAERMIVGCLLADPSLFHAEMHDGRELSESVLPGDLNHLPTRRLYQHVHDWLCDHETIQPGDLREVSEDESLVTGAVMLRDEAERVCEEDAGRIGRGLRAAVRRLADFQAEDAYAEGRIASDGGASGLADGPDDGTGAEHEQDVARILQAVEHARSHPTPARLPRVID